MTLGLVVFVFARVRVLFFNWYKTFLLIAIIRQLFHILDQNEQKQDAQSELGYAPELLNYYTVCPYAILPQMSFATNTEDKFGGVVALLICGHY